MVDKYVVLEHADISDEVGKLRFVFSDKDSATEYVKRLIDRDLKGESVNERWYNVIKVHDVGYKVPIVRENDIVVPDDDPVADLVEEGEKKEKYYRGYIKITGRKGTLERINFYCNSNPSIHMFGNIVPDTDVDRPDMYYMRACDENTYLMPEARMRLLVMLDNLKYCVSSSIYFIIAIERLMNMVRISELHPLKTAYAINLLDGELVIQAGVNDT